MRREARSLTSGDQTNVDKVVRRRVLYPVERASEILFGLIMVLTFTLSIVATGRANVRVTLVGALGCNLAWGIIDAVMYLMGTQGEGRLAASTLRAIQGAQDPAVGRTIVADLLPPVILPALKAEDLERIRLHFSKLPSNALEPRIGREDVLAALGVFLLVFLSLFPVVLPFLFVKDVAIALKISNGIAILLLFLTGFSFGRHVGRPWRTGMLMVVIGIVLVAIAMVLGG